MRIGGASALKWKDVDFEDRSILVRRNYVSNRIENSTNNGKVRRVDMSQQSASCLRTIKKKIAESALSNGQGSIDEEWHFYCN